MVVLGRVQWGWLFCRASAHICLYAIWAQAASRRCARGISLGPSAFVGSVCLFSPTRPSLGQGARFGESPGSYQRGQQRGSPPRGVAVTPWVAVASGLRSTGLPRSVRVAPCRVALKSTASEIASIPHRGGSGISDLEGRAPAPFCPTSYPERCGCSVATMRA